MDIPFPQPLPSSDSDPAASDCAQRNAAPEPDPRIVIRGETHPPDPSSSVPDAIIDWLSFTFWPSDGNDLNWLLVVLAETFKIPSGNWQQLDRGWYGYNHRIQLAEFGLVAFGGEAQRGSVHVQLKAHGCACIEDWNAVQAWGNAHTANITRVDLAHDDHSGQQINIETATAWCNEGKFSTNGRPPKAKIFDDLDSGSTPDSDPDSGATLYIGKRISGKLLRIYEKGKQLGDPSSPWVRAEVELHNKGRIIPWEVLTSPGAYLAGAYPALAFLSSTQSRLKTIQRSKEITLLALVRQLRKQYGKSINVIAQMYPNDPQAVLDLLKREGVPKRFTNYKHLLPPSPESEDE